MSQFRNLVFEGGGVKGIAYAGAVRVLEEKGILGEIKRVAGASAGAITAALLAAGAKSKDIQEIVGNTSFSQFMDDSWGVGRDLKRLVDDYGWFKGEAFSQWIRRQLQAFTGNPDITFAGLHARTGRDLFVIGTNLSMQMESVFSRERTPDAPVWHAVRVSMSIPLFFAAMRESSDVLVDGGVSWNYPIDLFDYKEFEPAPEAATPVTYTKYSESHVYNKETLGFRVDTKDEIKAEKDGWRSPPKPIQHLADYAAALVGFLQEMANKAHLHANDWDRTVFIDAEGVRTTDFSLPPDKVNQLVASGVKGTNDYFAWFENPKSTPRNRVGAR